ncbi:MAG TPA: hypothetical protein VMG08_12510 [Allosphingosinicella sp.]|nr:hypothetical protein [Allosphingosinicella sp.]
MPTDIIITLAIVGVAILFAGLAAWFGIVVPFRRAQVRRMKDPARATMLVTQMSLASASEEQAVWQGGAITGIVTIPGQAPFVHRQNAMILTDKFPKAGDILPIVIDRADHRRLAIQWDEIAAADPVQDGFRRA